MKNKFIIPLLCCLLISSCDDRRSRDHLHPINHWENFNDDTDHYHDYKINVSTYFEEDYIVIGFIEGEKDKNISINKTILLGYEIDFNLFDFQDSTGEEIVFDDFQKYEIYSTRTIKVSYSKFDDDIKEDIESKQTVFLVNNHKYHYSDNTKIQKVQYGDNLEFLDL